MPSYQRKYGGRTASIYPRVLKDDGRGNEQLVVDLDADPLTQPYAGWWIRSSRAEIPGQQTIEIRRIIVNYLDIDLYGVWSAVTLSDEPGSVWDITAPPQEHWGVRNNRHWSLDLRRRPDSA